MKKNFYYLSLLIGLVFGMTMFASCGGGDEDDNGGPSGGPDSGITAKFQGPKRVFGGNLLSSFETNDHYHQPFENYELVYNSDDFVTEVKEVSIYNDSKHYTTRFEVSYSDNQVIATLKNKPSESGSKYVFTIGSNGFAESYSYYNSEGVEKYVVRFEYDSEGHITKLTDDEADDEELWIGTMKWQDGNMVEQCDNDNSEHVMKWPRYCTYTDISNFAGAFIRADIGNDMLDLFDEVFYYMGLLGKGTKNLVKSYSDNHTSYSGYTNSITGENEWTLDDAGRPVKCVTTETKTRQYDSSAPSTITNTYYYIWNYR